MAEARKIAAILAVDVVGFSRLAGADEDRTLARLRALRSDLIDPTIAVHLAKGLEFRAVAVMACDDEVLPLQERIETASDESDLEETYNTERHLL